MKRVVGLAAFCCMALNVGIISDVKAGTKNDLSTKELRENIEELKKDPDVQAYFEIRENPKVKKLFKLRKRLKNADNSTSNNVSDESQNSEQTSKKKKKRKNRKNSNNSDLTNTVNQNDQSNTVNEFQSFDNNSGYDANNESSDSEQTSQKRKKRKKNRNRKNSNNSDLTNTGNQNDQSNTVNEFQSFDNNSVYDADNVSSDSEQTSQKRKKRKKNRNRKNRNRNRSNRNDVTNQSYQDELALNEPIIDSTRIKKSSVVVEKDIKLANKDESKNVEKKISPIELSPLDKKEVLAQTDSTKDLKLAANFDDSEKEIKEKLLQVNNERKNYNLIKTPEKKLKNNIKVNKFREELDRYRKLYSTDLKKA